jgi:hypothetical protein
MAHQISKRQAEEISPGDEKEDDSNRVSSNESNIRDKSEFVAVNPSLSHFVTNNDRDPYPPPDGGWKAWLSGKVSLCFI